MVSEAVLKKSTVVQLKKQCTDLGLSKVGRKADLVKRLLEHHAKAGKTTQKSPKKAPASKEIKKTTIVSASTETKAGTKNASEEDPVAARMARFGTHSEESKMAARAKRFGTTGLTNNKDFMSKRKLSARAQRFGLPAKADP